jgi:hypothetical protein
MNKTCWRFKWEDGVFAITEYEDSEKELPVLQRVEIPRDIFVEFVANLVYPEDIADAAFCEIYDDTYDIDGEEGDEQ